MENTFEFKNLSEVEQLAAPTADTTVMGFEAGKPVQLPASELGGSKVFIIDSTADDYATNNADYRNTLKEALLRGDRVLYYDGTAYFLVTAFFVNESTTGNVSLHVYAAGETDRNGVSPLATLYIFAITL